MRIIIVTPDEPFYLSDNISYLLKNLKKNNHDVVSCVLLSPSPYGRRETFSSKSKKVLSIFGLSFFVYYSLNVLEKISKLPRFIAMKEDAKNQTYTKMICKKISNQMTIITSGGGKRQWLKAAKHGCTSWLSGVSNLNPKISIDFYNYYKSKNIKKMNMIIKNIEDPFFKIKDKYGWHLTIKAFLELNKNFKRYERSPLKEINKDEMLKCKKVFEKIKKQIEIKKLAKYLN